MKRTALLIAVLLLIGGCEAQQPPVTQRPLAREPRFENPYSALYKSLEEMLWTYGEYDSEAEECVEDAVLVDFNADGLEELIVSYRDADGRHFAVFVYDEYDQQSKMVYRSERIQDDYDVDYSDFAKLLLNDNGKYHLWVAMDNRDVRDGIYINVDYSGDVRQVMPYSSVAMSILSVTDYGWERVCVYMPANDYKAEYELFNERIDKLLMGEITVNELTDETSLKISSVNFYVLMSGNEYWSEYYYEDSPEEFNEFRGQEVQFRDYFGQSIPITQTILKDKEAEYE